MSEESPLSSALRTLSSITHEPLKQRPNSLWITLYKRDVERRKAQLGPMWEVMFLWEVQNKATGAYRWDRIVFEDAHHMSAELSRAKFDELIHWLRARLNRDCEDNIILC
jgi:hypothetical protein